MVAASKLALFATAAASVAAAPVAAPAAAKSFSVPAVHNANYQRNGTLALLKAYAKYGLTPSEPDSIINLLLGGLAKRQDGTVPAKPDSQNVEYICKVTIGGQTLNLDFDTGSADLWVFSTSLPATSKNNHNVFDPTKSSTWQEMSGASWSIQYVDGSGSSGTVGTDTVTIGGTTVQGQAVEIATDASAQFIAGANDGLLGLSFSSINTVQPTQQNTFFDNAKASLDKPLFAAYLPLQASGAYDFGAIDSSRYTGEVAYTSVDNTNGWWEFPSTTYKVGSQAFSSAGYTAIADTGTTLLLMGDEQVTNYYNNVPGSRLDNNQGGYVFPCSATLPSLSVAIGDAGDAVIPAKYLNFGPAGHSDTDCFGSLQSSGNGQQNVYGDVFFNAFYGVFDASGPRFGFAATA
ncbi:Type I transmembrane sorting receptor [Pseudogymnoascus destructans]|uniref:Peptidase A1 domain-containing protein n=2 Tax=Pseudogymnoascus destructans TaxID=655981 RepID=L8FYN9_PSED2|nr:Type I transmembrane sorting receptor [Pseudogymnoascus destructans]ELR06110.1 hypothetical protein GMDG_01984 [Pseudogymnoascus destructans 20631-21]OAF61989.1 Type I transmembrane sorting receptor [Pseudogymnoascus destructans]